MNKNRAIIGLGSNIAPHENIRKAVQLIRSFFTVENQSAFVLTKPIGDTAQDDFINGCVLVSTAMNKDEVVARLKQLEQMLGRVKTTNKYGPRIIDLDLLTFNGEIEDPDVFQRDFIQKSILEIDPDFSF